MSNRNRDIRCRTALEAVALYIARSRSHGHARRGTVMVFVMAILGILFIAGVAFLQEVTFNAKTIEADEQVRAQEAIVDSIEVLVESTLKSGVLGQGGIPYSPASSELVYDISTTLLTDGSDPLGYSATPYEYLEWKSYGLILSPWAEVPGIHPLIGQIEPYGCNLIHSEAPDAQKVMYDTRPRIASTTDLWGLTNGPKYPAIIAQPRLDWGVIGGASDGGDEESQWQRWWHPITPSGPMLSSECAVNMDADADGIADSLGLRFEPGNTQNAAFRSITASQWESAFAKNKDEDQMYSGYAAVGVRVIPHTALCNLIYSHPWTINYILGDDATSGNFDSGSYVTYDISTPRPVAEIVEPELRNRNMIPTRNTVTDSLFDGISIDSENPLFSALETANGYRWWPFDPEDSNDVEPTMCTGAYRTLMDASNTVSMPPVDPEKYDRRHLVTTVSSDDLLLRGVRFPTGHPLAGQDVIEWITNYDSEDDGAINGSDPFRLDEYIREHGRVQLSFEELDSEMSALGPIWNSLSQTDRKQAVADAIRDMFWVMLWNQPDMNHDGFYEYKAAADLQNTHDDWIRAVQAASLAANVMDYVDLDEDPASPSTDLYTPTIVSPVDPAIADNAFNDYQVYGLEKQPFITEVYTDIYYQYDNETDKGLLESQCLYAIELFNPYDVRIDLTQYKIKCINPGSLEIDEYPNGEASEFEETILTGSLDPHEFKAFRLYGSAANSDVEAIPSGDQGVFNNSSLLLLTRIIDTKDVVVDQIDLENTLNIITPLNAGSSLKVGEIPTQTTDYNKDLIFSVQRDTTKKLDATGNQDTTAAVGSSWRFTIPLAVEVLEADVSIGLDNATITNAQNPLICSVIDDQSNIGDFASSFPTTGALLFALRQSHLYNSADPTKSLPFNYVVLAGNSLYNEFNRIDNGHMPIFDTISASASPQLDANNMPYWSSNHRSYIPAWPAADGDPMSPYCGQPGGISQLPWGQLIFDYFTRLPLNTPQTLDEYLDSSNPGRTDCLPYVEEDGHRVHGRININAAPWKVLAGLPMKQWPQFYNQPPAIQDRIWSMLLDSSNYQSPTLGHRAAYGIVAYREARDLPEGCTNGDSLYCTYSYAGRVLPPQASGIDNNLGDPQVVDLPGIRQGKGFLTVGELFNIHHYSLDIDDSTRWNDAAMIKTDRLGMPIVECRMDGGVVGRTVQDTATTYEDYIQAIAWTVACCDWVTTKSNVFTVYGVLSDPGPDLQPDASARQDIDDRAVRFQSTYDRTPLLTDPDAAMNRVGERRISMYNDPRSD